MPHPISAPLKLAWFTRLLTSCTVALLLTSTVLAEHPFHNSVAEMEWNEESQVFEIALSVWPVDLEKVLRDSEEVQKQIKTTVNIDDEQQHRILDPAISRYVESKLRAEIQGQPLKMKWLGFEVEKDSVWCYFEWSIPQPEVDDESKEASTPWTAQLFNELFFELQDDQQNTILFRQESKRRAIHFVKAHPRQKFEWDPTASLKK